MQQLTKSLSEPKLYRIVAIFLTLASLVLSLTPGDPTKISTIPHLDKLIHLGAYASLYGAYWYGFISPNKKHYSLPLALGICFYSGSLEVLQSWMDLGREGDFWDFVANSFGIFFVYFKVRLLR